MKNLTKFWGIAVLVAAIMLAFIACEGPAGPMGPQGIQGEKGDTGGKGDQGEKGETGAKGETGNKGDQGEKGNPGEKGSQGEKGETGAKGDPGDIIITVNGSGTSGSDIKAVIQDAVNQAIAADAGSNDGSTPEKALNISFTGDGIDLDDDIAMKALFSGIKDYYVNLDLSGVSGEVWAYYPLSALIDKSKILAITLGSNVKEIINDIIYNSNNVAFYGFTGLKSITALGVTRISERNLSGCVNLTSVSFPAAIDIGAGGFKDLRYLNSVDLPAATSIGNYAFEGCISLTSVNIPSATNINDGVFYRSGDTSLTIILGATPPTVGISCFAGIGSKNVTVKFPASAVAAYGAEPTDNTTQNWGNAFRGIGWDGTDYGSWGEVNERINLTYQTY